MSATLAKQTTGAVGVASANGNGNGNGNIQHADDPFTTSPSQSHPSHPHRYSTFDTQLFALNHQSPTQAIRALEAHLSETERRLQEASKLGTALVQQRKDLTERLREVESQKEEGDIGPELRQKLSDIEKEYNELGRESARAFLGPKPRVPLSEETANAPFALNGGVSNFILQANELHTDCGRRDPQVLRSSPAKLRIHLPSSTFPLESNGTRPQIMSITLNSSQTLALPCWHR